MEKRMPGGDVPMTPAIVRGCWGRGECKRKLITHQMHQRITISSMLPKILKI